MMQSNLTNGDSQAIGQACLLTFSLTCALAFAEGIPPELGAGYSKLVAAVVTRICPGLLEPARPAKGGRRRQAPAEAPVDPTSGATEGAVARGERSGTGPSAGSPGDANGAQRDASVSVAEGAVAGLEARLAASGHSSPDEQ